ncbi:MAG: hypothetical protein Q8Q67_01095 [bacterium]|nr:hypothetical protein [bacterium]
MYLQFQPTKDEHKKIGSFNVSEENSIYQDIKETKEAFFASLSDNKFFYVKKESGIRLNISSVKQMPGSNGYMEFEGEAGYSEMNIFNVEVKGVISFNV